jgi:hypothetical protein
VKHIKAGGGGGGGEEELLEKVRIFTTVSFRVTLPVYIY